MPKQPTIVNHGLRPRDPIVVRWLDASIDVDAEGGPHEVPAANPQAVTETIGWFLKIQGGQLLMSIDRFMSGASQRTITRIPLVLIRRIMKLGRGRLVYSTVKGTSTSAVKGRSKSELR